MTSVIIGLYSGRHWPKFGGKLQKEKKFETKKKRPDLMLIGYHAIRTTYALKQIIQLTNCLPLLPLYAANPDSRSVDGPFPPDRSAVLCSLSDENVWASHYSQYPLTERYRFLGFASPSRGRLAFDIEVQLSSVQLQRTVMH